MSDTITDTNVPGDELDGLNNGTAGSGNWVRDFVVLSNNNPPALNIGSPSKAGTIAANPRDVATGEFQSNGVTDYVVTDYDAVGAITVLMGNGFGGFSTATTYATGGGDPMGVTVGDFNGDGKLDIAVVNSSNNTVGILLGNGDGTFGAATTYSTGGTTPEAIVEGYFNNDGHLDLAVANTGSNSVAILLGNGTGAFAPATTYATGGSLPDALAVADFNGDGKADLAVANGDGNSVGILLGDGQGHFGAATTFATGGTSDWCLGVAVGDFNNDGKIDLAMANAGDNTVGILMGNGDGTFQAATTYSTGGTWPQSIAVGDFFGDGNLDVVVDNHDSGTLSFFAGDGTGNFAAPVVVSTSSVGSTPEGLVASDVNGGGKPDVVVAFADTAMVADWLNFSDPGPTVLNSADGLPFGVATGSSGAGSLVQGYKHAFNGDGRLVVGGVAYQPAGLATTTNDGQTVVTADGTADGLIVSRAVTVPTAGNVDFARTIDTFTNPTAVPITATVQYIGNLGSGPDISILNTSAGGTTWTPADQWVETFCPGSPVVIHYIHGSGLVPTSVEIVGDNITWSYSLTVSPGQTVRLGDFTIVATTQGAAEAAAATLVSPTGFGGQAAAFLSQDEVDSLVNFRTLVADSLTPPSATEEIPTGDVKLFNFSVFYPNPNLANFSATIAWGDGTTSPGYIAPDPVQGFDVFGSHTYVQELSGATFSVSVTDATDNDVVSLSDDDFSVADQQITVPGIVAQNVPSIAAQGASIGPIADIATFTDPAGRGVETNADFVASINWGDGTSSPGTIDWISGGNYQVDAPSHTYANAALVGYGITVTVTHDALPPVTSSSVTIAVLAPRR